MVTVKEKSENRVNKESVRFPYYVLFFSILLTLGATVLFYQSAKSKDDTRFSNGVNRIRFSLENRIGLYFALLQAGRGFIESSDTLNKKKFADFVESLEIQKNYHGALGIGYTQTVRSSEREKFIAERRAEGFADYDILPQSDKEIYQPIVYFQPLSELNERAMGFDMSSEASRWAAMQRARDTDSASATAKIVLLQVQEQNGNIGFLIYLPIYNNGEHSANVEERQKNLRGFIYSPFRAKNFLKDVQDNAGTNDIVIRIYDGVPDVENLLAQSEILDKQTLPGQISGTYSTQSEIEVGGRKWMIQYDSLPSFAGQSSVNWTPLIFLCGLIFSLLLFGMTYWETATRAKLQQTANVLTESEQQIQGLLEKEQAARRIAETANATKDEFISVVSHELRTPLNAIAGWTRILKSADLSVNTKDLALQKIEKNLRLQTNLVEDLLSYSQLVSSKENLEKKEVDCSEIFESVFQEFEPIAVKKGITLTKDNQLNGQKLLGDAEKLKIVIINLFSNALKFTPSNGNIKTRIGKIENWIEIVIEDSGSGISPEFLPHIFDRFSQYDTSTTRKFGGLGLGLAVSKHIVKLHNGTIEAKSEGEGKGSTFSVKIPVYAR
ncbi:MAG TPA: CHASE domain-containing protein [Pyrinomonadaceae bacterium]|nr:CHASE domain-containing protein [Pyrinomonadaceae bacterium]